MYRSKRIDSSNFMDYEKLIPENYGEMICSGRLSGGVIYESEDVAEKNILVYVMTIRSGWMELIWLDVFDRDRDDVFYSALVRTMIRKECFRRGESLKGVYAEFYAGIKFRADRIRNVMLMAGMVSNITKGNVYEFTLREVVKNTPLQKAIGKMKCISLADANEQLFEKLDEMIQQDSRPSPLPLFVNWIQYLQEESLICMKGEDPCGILLLSRRMDSVVIDCAFVTDKMALVSLLGNAYKILKTKYGEDQKILVPVVVDRTAAIVERLVPTAERGDVVEAVMWLE